MATTPKRGDDDLSTTDSFNLLFVIFGLGLLLLVGWQLVQHWSVKASSVADGGSTR